MQVGPEITGLKVSGWQPVPAGLHPPLFSSTYSGEVNKQFKMDTASPAAYHDSVYV